MSTAISIYHGSFGRAKLYQPDRRVTTHAHREGHLIFLLEGQDSHQIVSGMRYELTPVSATAINPWEPHDFNPGDSHGGIFVLTLYIKPIWFLEVARSARSALRFGRTQIEVTDFIGRSIRKVVTLLLEDCGNDLFEGYLYELTQQCYDQSWQWNPAAPLRDGIRTSSTDFRVRKSMRLIGERLGDEIELDLIARDAGLSRPHFYKLFRQQTGITPNLFLNTLRMEQAIRNLAESDQSVTDIGFDLGFSSQSGFTRFFRSNVGMAPTEYRRVAHILNA